MRRNEMLKIMADTYRVGLKVVKDMPDGGDQTMLLMELILTQMEELGMEPPLNENVYCNMDNNDRRIINASKHFYTWEKED